VVSRSDQYSESGLSDWLSPVAWLTGVWKLVYIPAVVIALLCRYHDHRSDFGIAHYIGLEKPVLDTIRRTHYSLVTLVALAFIPFLLYWNLLGFQF